MANKYFLIWGDDNLFENANNPTDSYQVLGVRFSNGLFETGTSNVTGSGNVTGYESFDVGSITGTIGGVQKQNLPDKAAANFWADQNIFQTVDDEESVIIRSSAARPLSSIVFAVQNSGGVNVFDVDNVGNVRVQGNAIVSGNVQVSGNALFDDLEVDGTLTVGSSATVTWGPTSTIINLNADRLDDLTSTQFLRSDVDDTYDGGTLTVGSSATLEVGGTLTVDSSATVTWGPTGTITNLNADNLDDLNSTQFLRSDVDDTFDGGTLTVGSSSTLAVSGTLTVDTSAIVNSYGEVNLHGGRTTLHYSTPEGIEEYADLKPNGLFTRYGVDIATGVSAYHGARVVGNRELSIDGCDCTTLLKIPIVVPQTTAISGFVYAAGPGAITRVAVATGATGGIGALVPNDIAFWDPDNLGKVTSRTLAPVSGNVFQSPAGIVLDIADLSTGYAVMLVVKQRDMQMLNPV